MLAWLSKLQRNLRSRRSQRRLMAASCGLRGRYDAATTNDDNRRHWAAADGLSANAANNPQVRRVLRNRARYEVANNSYARGIVLTLANDVVGTGPRLQMLTADAEANSRIEREFMSWSRAVALPEKLRTMRLARAVDGEAFAILTSNSRLPTSIQLDLRLVEADQVCTPSYTVDVADATVALASVVLALGSAGVLRLLRRDRRTLLAMAALGLPYLGFHLLFQDTSFIRYALPLVPVVSFLAVQGLALVPSHGGLFGAAALTVWSVAVAAPVVASYAATPAPAVRAVEAMNQAGTIGCQGEAKSGKDGEFLIEGLAEGVYTVRVKATYFDASPLQRVEAGDTGSRK